MGRAFAHSILAVLLIAVPSSMAFPSSIHEKMTSAERLAVFNSKDSVPEYEVFAIPLPGARHRRNGDKNINLEIDLHGTKIKLNLKPTTRYLASKYMPVWSAQSDKHAYKKIRYDPLPKAMSDVGEFKMYRDVENDAAVTVYEDPVEGSVMEGIFNNFYVIRSLPKRLMGELLKVEGYVLKPPGSVKRSVPSDTEEGKVYYVVFKIPAAPEDVITSGLVDLDNLLREKRARHTGAERKVPKEVYPEILIVIDYSIIRYHTLTQVLRFTLAFWNAVDLMYRAFDKPKIYLNIAGIIVAGNNSTTPYIAKIVSTEPANADSVLSNMGKYFYKEKDRFPVNRYDIIIAMTALHLYRLNNGDRHFGQGFKVPNATACSSTRKESKTKTIENIGIVRHYWQLYQVRKAAEITAYLLGAKKDVFNAMAAVCRSEGGRNMTKERCLAKLKKQGSNSNQRVFSRYFLFKKSGCLQNKPLWIKQAGEVLPGRWLTLDGQCKNEGYAKACKLKKFSTCAVKGCRVKGTGKCVRTTKKALPGSTCGVKKHCSTKKKCVRG